MPTMTLEHPDAARLFDVLRDYFATDGTPLIAVERTGQTLTFTSETGGFMLRSRVAAALSEAGW